MNRDRIMQEYDKFPTDNYGNASIFDFAEHIATIVRNETLKEAAIAAFMHNNYPITNESERQYDKGRKDASAAILALKQV